MQVLKGHLYLTALKSDSVMAFIDSVALPAALCGSLTNLN